jgi:hypothetical protein
MTKHYYIYLCLFTLFFIGCVPLSDSITDYMNDGPGCQPVTETCMGSTEKFFSQPQMRALESWRGRTVKELITEWGYPDRVDKDPGGLPGERYVYVEEFYATNESRAQYDYRFDDWDTVTEPTRRYRCETYMLISEGGVITPLWVNRLGVCTRLFNPRPSAPPKQEEPKK